MNWPRRVGGGTGALPALRNFACWRNCSRNSTRAAAGRWRPGLASRAGPVLATWRNRERRAGLEERLRALTRAGYLAPMLQRCSRIRPGAGADARDGQRGGAGAGRIDAELAQIAAVRRAGPPRPRASARRSPPASG